MTIQRWAFMPGATGPRPRNDGPYVTYADHVAALRQAVNHAKDVAVKHTKATHDRAYSQGQRDERARWFAVDHEGKPGAGLAGYSVGYEVGQLDALAGAVQRAWEVVTDISLTDYEARHKVIAAIKGGSDDH
jgi:hypothetical protein